MLNRKWLLTQVISLWSIYIFSISCLSSSETTQSQNPTSVLTALSPSPTRATWLNISASTPEWNPTPARTATSASDSSVTFSSTTGKSGSPSWVSHLPVCCRSLCTRVCVCVFLSILIQNSHRRSAVQMHPSRLWEILHTTLKFTGVK